MVLIHIPTSLFTDWIKTESGIMKAFAKFTRLLHLPLKHTVAHVFKSLSKVLNSPALKYFLIYRREFIAAAAGWQWDCVLLQWPMSFLTDLIWGRGSPKRIGCDWEHEGATLFARPCPVHGTLEKDHGSQWADWWGAPGSHKLRVLDNHSHTV